jgi:hypothetical protein
LAGESAAVDINSTNLWFEGFSELLEDYKI